MCESGQSRIPSGLQESLTRALFHPQSEDQVSRDIRLSCWYERQSARLGQRPAGGTDKTPLFYILSGQFSILQ